MVNNNPKPHLRCFKYRSGESALRCLVDGALYFAKPAELNDMLETKFDPATSSDFSKVYLETLLEVSLQRGAPHIPVNPRVRMPERLCDQCHVYQPCVSVGWERALTSWSGTVAVGLKSYLQAPC